MCGLSLKRIITSWVAIVVFVVLFPPSAVTAFSTFACFQRKNHFNDNKNSKSQNHVHYSSTTSSLISDDNSKLYDVVIVGGSYAGLSAALTLGRSMRKVLVVDSQQPCNSAQPLSYNLLTHDGISPKAIKDLAISNLSKYGTINFLTHGPPSPDLSRRASGFKVTKMERLDNGNFRIDAAESVAVANNVDESSSSSSSYEARKVIIATGVKDILPDDVPGLEACWGKTVIHCSYCHGYEFRNQPTALLGMDLSTLQKMVPVVHTLTKDLHIILLPEEEEKDGDVLELYEKHHIAIISEGVVEIQHDGAGQVTGIRFEDDQILDVDCIYIRPPFQQQYRNIVDQPLELDDNGYIQVDDNQKTSVEGIMACGDCTTPNRSLSIAIATGTKAAKMLNYELSVEDFQRGE